MKKLIVILFMLFGIGVTGTIISVSATGGFSLDTYKIEDKWVSKKTFNKLHFSFSSSDIEVIPTENSEVSVELDGKISRKYKEQIKLVAEEKGDTLDIHLAGENQIKLNIGILIVDTTIRVYLPEKEYEEVIVESASGDISINDLSAKKLTFQASSGNISVDGSTAKQTTIQTSSGDIKLSDSEGNLDATASSGTIKIYQEELTGNIHSQSSSGNVTIGFQKDPSSVSVDFKGSSGEGKVDLDTIKYDLKEENRLKGTIGDGQYNINVETSSGDFLLE